MTEWDDRLEPPREDGRSFELDEVVAGRYAIVRLLGRGGMGEVYEAEDRLLHERVALKTVRPGDEDFDRILTRFRREILLARRVTSPSVCRIFDAGIHARPRGGECAFLTMELLAGETLAARLARSGPIAPDEALPLVAQLAAALDAAHAAGVVHRDFKPGNVIVIEGDRGPRVVVTDFGLALGRGPGSASATVSTEGLLVGSPAYMAPEQAWGGEITPATDVYALGVVLYQMVTGRLPFVADNPLAVALMRVTVPPASPRVHRPSLPAAWERAILACLTVEPTGRPRSAGAVLEELLRTDSGTLPLPAPTVRPDTTLAVLPFRGGAPDDGYVADGLTDDLTDTLSMTRGLRVRPRSYTAQLPRDADPRQLSGLLDVQVVVEGTVRRAGERTRITARAINLEDQFQIWAQRFDVLPGDLLTVSDTIAGAIAAALAVDLATHGRARPVDPEAVELYLRGRHELRKHWSDDPSGAVELFARAMARAPDDPNIVATWAMALSRMAFLRGGAAVAEALRAAERSVVVAPQLGESWSALSAARLYSGDPVGAAQATSTGIRLVPTAAGLLARLGRLQLEVGLVDEAVGRLETAARLDPGLLDITEDLARAYALLGRWEDAERLLAGELIEDFQARLTRAVHRARLDLWRGRPVVIPAEVEAAHETFPMVVDYIHLARGVSLGESLDPARLERFERGAARPRGRFSTFLWQLITELHALAGRADDALVALERSVASGLVDVVWLERCPVLEQVRAEVRSHDLRRRAEAQAAPLRAAISG